MKNDLIIGGDFVFTRSVNENTEPFEGFSILKELFSDCGLVCVNLECPVTSCQNFIKKQGPHLSCDYHALDVLKNMGVNCVSLANNHILDYGSVGLRDTISELDKRDIQHVGAGDDINQASAILYVKIGEWTVSIINCCEHEFSVASDKTAGTNPLNPITQYYQIQKAKLHSDYVIVIVHGGVEHFQYPTIRMKNTYRFFVDAGADIIVNHHQHCPCGFEMYKGKPIYYGLGNFYFEWKGKKNSIWNYGYFVRIVLKGNGLIDTEILPYKQCDEKPIVTLLENNDLDKFREMLVKLCNVVLDNSLLFAELKDFNSHNDYLYRKMFEPYSGKILNGLYRRGILPSFMNKERLLALMDYILCESHYERVQEYLEREYKEYNNE